MDKENVAYICIGMLLSLKKVNPAICDNMDESLGYYEISKEASCGTNTTQFFFFSLHSSFIWAII